MTSNRHNIGQRLYFKPDNTMIYKITMIKHHKHDTEYTLENVNTKDNIKIKDSEIDEIFETK